MGIISEKAEFNILDWYDNKSTIFKSRWSFSDMEWLSLNYTKLKKQEILSHFNNEVNYKTIVNIMQDMGIKKFNKNSNWSIADIEFLEKHYPAMEQSKLENRFSDRTWDSIKTKASRLNIARTEDFKIKLNSDSHKGFMHSEESKRKMSISRTGSNNHNWSGGLSPIVVAIRGYVSQWKLDSLAKYDYKCGITNVNDRTLEVHHLNKNFSEIMYEAFSELGSTINNDLTQYSDAELLKFKNKIIELHYKYGLGIPLTAKLHRLFHSLYGNKNNTYEQFVEFKQNYLDGKLNNYIN